MNIHEYQGKEIFRAMGVAVPEGRVAFTAEEAVEKAKELNSEVYVVKAQIHAGGRGKAGGVKIAKSLSEVETYANELLGKQLVTHQTDLKVKKLNAYISKKVVIFKRILCRLCHWSCYWSYYIDGFWRRWNWNWRSCS